MAESTEAGSAQQGPADTQTGASYLTLAACWRAPSAELVAAVTDGDLRDVFEQTTAVELGELEREFTRLFVGPGDHPCPPYESVYRDAEADQSLGPVMGESTRAVEKWYHEHGVTLAESNPELPDHVSTELEFLGYLEQTADPETARQFREEHLDQWIHQFLEDVDAATESPFYRDLVAITRVALAPT
jgi:TorA maturation chaperone TorD